MRRILIASVLVLVPLPLLAADEADESALKAAGLPSDNIALLDFIRQRSRDSAPADELAPLIKELASPDPKAAERASAGLIARGPLAVPALRRAVNDLNDKTQADRARKCLGHIEGRSGADLVAAVTRLIGARRVPSAVELLLGFMPYADDAMVLDAIGVTLGQLAYAGGKADAALLKAIESDVPLLRAAASEALARTDHPETRLAIAKRLSDPVRPVRQRAALALARVEDIAAIPVLIDLLADLTKAERVPVDEMLRSLAGETAPKNTPQGEDEKDRKALRDAWAGWWRRIDGPALVDEFRARTLHPSELPKVAEMIKQLGDANYRVREKSSRELVSMGAKVLADLRLAVKDPDGERARRAEDCINKINASDSKRVPIGTARLAALRRPDEAAPAMLNYLPYADDDDGIVAEIKSALITLALDVNGKVEPALVQALSDSNSTRRAAASEALAKGGGLTIRDDIKKLLTDKDLLVRQSAAAALAVAGEKDAIPVLIDLLAELPATQTWPSQDVLHQLAGDKAPAALSGDKPEDLKKYRDGWVTWWKANSMSTDLSKLTTGAGYLGYTLLVQVSNNNSIGRVAEVGRDGKIRWQIGNLKYPVDAQVLPGERVLVTEWDGNRVAEFDFRGNVIWKKEGFTGRATNAQRLPNGNTFICTTNELLEVDRSGRALYTVRVNQGLTAGYRASNGEIICLRNDGQCVRYDTAGKEIKSFASNRDTSWTSGIDLARNGNILISQPSPSQKVTEYSPDGKVVKEWTTPQITTATKLANGNILAASHNDQKVIELDPSGKKVWEYKDEYHIFRAKRR
jgi:HEAT repeat protein